MLCLPGQTSSCSIRLSGCTRILYPRGSPSSLALPHSMPICNQQIPGNEQDSGTFEGRCYYSTSPTGIIIMIIIMQEGSKSWRNRFESSHAFQQDNAIMVRGSCKVSCVAGIQPTSAPLYACIHSCCQNERCKPFVLRLPLDMPCSRSSMTL
eukprot:1409473-Amphidinium_carterae.1